MATNTRAKKKNSTWQDSFVWRAYELARAGMTDKNICSTLGISIIFYKRWLASRPSFNEAIEAGRSYKEHQGTFKEYIFKRLPPELQSLWNKLLEVENDDSATSMIEALFADGGKLVRQQLFIHAYITSVFNASEACRKVGISYNTFKEWTLTDPDFAKLIDEMNWHKGNFFEEALFDLVAKRDTAATIFANKTFNKKRGYSEKIEVALEDKTDTGANVIDVTQLELPLEVRRELLAALRKHQEQKLLPHVVDVEVLPQSND